VKLNLEGTFTRLGWIGMNRGQSIQMTVAKENGISLHQWAYTRKITSQSRKWTVTTHSTFSQEKVINKGTIRKEPKGALGG